MAFNPATDLGIYKGNYGAPGGDAQDPLAGRQKLLDSLKFKGGTAGVAGASAAPPPMMPMMPQPQAEAPQDPSVASLVDAAGQQDQSPDAAFMGAGPGMMRPGLPTQKPAPDDGGLRALQRRVY